MGIIQWMNEALERKYFTEDYASDRKKYTELVGVDKRLTPEEFDRCCNADPTYEEGSNKSGSYLTWIIKRYTDFRKNNPNKEFDFTSCTDDLKSFNEIVTHKLFLKDDDEKHDINYFTSLQELDDFVKGKGTHKEESGKQQQRNQNATTIKVDHVDPDLVFENNRCKVWVPYTYETSRKLGGDTRWCTAASTRENWDSYSKEGPLFIMIMKDDPKEKYQFFFEKTQHHKPQYMDRNDDPVDLSRFPEMQMPWVDEVRKDYYGTHDKITASQLDSILNPDGTAPEGRVEQAGDLINNLHDETLISKYSAPINKECLDLFYKNLTPTLTQDSKAIESLKQCVGTVDVVLPRSVKRLGDRCFWYCKSLRSITIPDSITALHGDCFSYCMGLKGVNLPESITSLPAFCFYYCIGLERINLPDSITSLGSYCFSLCTNLQGVHLPDSLTSLYRGCFYNCSSLREIKFPDSLISLEEQDFEWCKSLRRITLPNSVTCIGMDCFEGCPIKDIYYNGSEEDRKHIQIESGNEALHNATWHYNCKG